MTAWVAFVASLFALFALRTSVAMEQTKPFSTTRLTSRKETIVRNPKPRLSCCQLPAVVCDLEVTAVATRRFHNIR